MQWGPMCPWRLTAFPGWRCLLIGLHSLLRFPFSFGGATDRWKLCVHLEEPLLPASSRNVSGTAHGHRWAGRAALWGGQRQGCGEFRVLGQEEEEKEIPGPGDATCSQLHAILSFLTTILKPHQYIKRNRALLLQCMVKSLACLHPLPFF